MRKSERNIILVAGIVLGFYYVLLRVTNRLDLDSKINIAQFAEITMSFILVLVTAIYVARTAEIANAAREQAKATTKTIEEMKEQRIMSSRPVVIQRPVYTHKTSLDEFRANNYLSHFEIINVGNGPAIELEISLLNKDKTPIYSIRRTFRKTDDPPFLFSLSEITKTLEESSDYYLVSEYQSIATHGSQPTCIKRGYRLSPLNRARKIESTL